MFLHARIFTCKHKNRTRYIKVNSRAQWETDCPIRDSSRSLFCCGSNSFSPLISKLSLFQVFTVSSLFAYFSVLSVIGDVPCTERFPLSLLLLLAFVRGTAAHSSVAFCGTLEQCAVLYFQCCAPRLVTSYLFRAGHITYSGFSSLIVTSCRSPTPLQKESFWSADCGRCLLNLLVYFCDN